MKKGRSAQNKYFRADDWLVIESSAKKFQREHKVDKRGGWREEGREELHFGAYALLENINE